MASIRALCLAALATAASGEDMYMVITHYPDGTCSNPVQRPYAAPARHFFPPPLGDAVNDCVEMNGTYAKIEDCTIKYYTQAGCFMDPVFETPAAPGGCQYDDEHGTSTSVNCFTYLPEGVAYGFECIDGMPGEFSPTCEACFPPTPPPTCEEALGVIDRCESQCTDEDVDSFFDMMKMLFGCSCGPGGDDGSSGPTCGDVKYMYKMNECCGNPSKPFEFPQDDRRLAGAAKARARVHPRSGRASPAKASRWLAPARRLASTIFARVDAGRPEITPADDTEHALRAMQKLLDNVRLRHGKAAATALAAKAKSFLSLEAAEGVV